jgi:single-strand DNA-binding protein
MPSLNIIFLIGNLCRDPEVRYTPKQTAVAEISLAVNRTWKGEDGERQEEVTFVNCTLWGRQAEVAGQYLKKGRSIFLEGRLQMDSWDDKQTGQKRSRLRVVAENLQMLRSAIDFRQDSDAASSGARGPARPAGSTEPATLRISWSKP